MGREKAIQTRRMRMIEIIKHGKKKYTFRCDSCGCEFTTDGAEIFREKRINGKAWIYCPECGSQILIPYYMHEQMRHANVEEE
jgi:DNA-directed RNA polymerase subunit RPC12/RpoP